MSPSHLSFLDQLNQAVHSLCKDISHVQCTSELVRMVAERFCSLGLAAHYIQGPRAEQCMALLRAASQESMGETISPAALVLEPSQWREKLQVPGTVPRAASDPCIIVPVFRGSNVDGCLAVFGRGITSEAASVFETCARILSLELTRISGPGPDHAAGRFASSLLEDLNFEKILARCVGPLVELAGVDRAFSFVVDSETLHCVGASGVPEELRARVLNREFKVRDGSLMGDMEAGKVRLLHARFDDECLEGLPRLLDKMRVAVLVPVRGREHALALLLFGVARECAPSALDITCWEEAARQLGLALENAQLFEVVRRSRGRFRQLVDTANAIIFEVDNDGRFTHFNDTAEAITGWQRGDLIGSSLEILVAEEKREELQELWRKVRSCKTMLTIEFSIRTRGGKEHLIQWSTAEDVNDRGESVGVVFVGQDITRQRELEQSLRQTEKLAALGTMLSGIAHELNNPLTAVIGFTQMLLEDEQRCAQIAKELGLVHEQGKRCREVVANLLRFARQEKGVRLGIDLNRLIQDCLRLREYHLRLENIDVVCELDKELLTVAGDPEQLRTAILNVINNAHDAMAEKSKGGTLFVRTRKRDERTIAIEVEDTGGGIEAPERIFEPFYTTKEVGKGTGLGLSVTYGIITDHGGSIKAANTQQGALFTIELPAASDFPITEFRPELERPSKIRHATGQTILVVDDDPSVTTLVSKLLKARGYSVVTENSAFIARRHLASQDFAAIVTDIRMPGDWDGIQLYEWAKQHRPHLAARFGFISGDLISEKARHFIADCGRPVLAKPFEISEFLDLVSDIATKSLS